MKKFTQRSTTLLLAAGMGLAAATAWSAESLQDVMKRRGLSQQDLLAASKTYVPTGKRDEFIAFSSGGQSGQVIVYGIPSMRILKYIGVFTPEPWQGYGFDEESKKVLRRRQHRRQGHHLGRHAPPGALRNQRRVRRPVPVHQRQGQPAPGGDRPARLRDQADRRQPDLTSPSTAAPSSPRTPNTSSKPRSTPRRWRTRSSTRSKSSTRSIAAA